MTVFAISERDEKVHFPDLDADDFDSIKFWLRSHGNYTRAPRYYTLEAHTVRIGGSEYVVLSDDNARIDGNPHNVSLLAVDRGIDILGPIVICKQQEFGLLGLEEKDLKNIMDWIVCEPNPVVIALWGPWR